MTGEVCAAELHIADDYGDNHATIKCQLEKGHEDAHVEKFDRNGEATITWVCDERESESESESDDDHE